MKKYNIIVMIGGLLLLPSCGRIIDFGTKTFVQAPSLNASIVAQIKNMLALAINKK